MDLQRCNKCGSEWKSNIKSTRCPFCGNEFYSSSETSLMSVSGAISQIISDRGIDVLKNGRIVISLVTDYVQGCDRDKKLLRIAVQNDALLVLYSIHQADNQEQKDLISQRLIKKLENDAFLSKENSQYIVSLLLKGIESEGNDISRSDSSDIRTAKGDIAKEQSKVATPADTSSAIDTYVGQLKVGDKVNFGSYSFESYSKKQAIEWRILDIKDGRALLWSELCLDIQPYCGWTSCSDWRKSSLREWLRDSFVSEYHAFPNSRELNAICTADVEESKNPKSGRVSGKITRQKAFILSKEEIERYALSKEVLAAKATPYAERGFNGHPYKKGIGNHITGLCYWLRTPGISADTQLVVGEDGQINEVKLEFCELGVRPAIWVDYKKLDKIVQKEKALYVKQQPKRSFSDSAVEAFKKGEEYDEKRDYQAAIACYQSAADEGHLLAQCKLGEIFMYGHGVKTDRDKAISLIEPVAKQGDAYAQRILGICYHLKADEIKAREFYELAAKQGDIEAQEKLANSYTQGYYNGPVDYNEAAKWYKLAADQGDHKAQYSLGVCYYEGRGIDQDYQKAVELFLKAEKQLSNVFAEWALGICYEYGQGVEPNEVTALKWYKKAARNGHPEAKEKVKELTQK